MSEMVNERTWREVKEMIRTVLLDCGGVMVLPPTGDWVLSPGYEQILGGAFMQEHLQRFRQIRHQFISLLPDANIVKDEGTEHSMFVEYYRQVFAEMDMEMPPEALERLAHIQVFVDERYQLFEDVLPFLDRWRQRYRVGIVSDAPPSTRRIMNTMGVSERVHAATYSCDLGILKPGPEIYQSTLNMLGMDAGSAVFVDDMPEKLQGAQALGIRCVQMRRPMPPNFNVAPQWAGPVVHDFAELESLLNEWNL